MKTSKILNYWIFFSDTIKYSLIVGHDQRSTDPASDITVTIFLPHYVTFKMVAEASLDSNVEVSRYDDETNNVQIKV